MEDSFLVASPEEVKWFVVAAQAVLDMGMPMDSDLTLLLQPPDPAAPTAFWVSLHQQFADDWRLMVRAGCYLNLHQFPGCDKKQALRLFEQAFTLLPGADHDGDPATLTLLYLMGMAHFMANDYAKATPLLTRFLVHAVPDGHRKAAEVHFVLGQIAAHQCQDSGRSPAGKQALHAAADHSRRGAALVQAIPPFLQLKQDAAFEQALAKYVSNLSIIMGIPVDVPPPAVDRPSLAVLLAHDIFRGGELLEGPQRHEKLQYTTSRLANTWKKARVQVATASPTPGNRKASHAQPSRPRGRSRAAKRALAPVTIDEMVGVLSDRVYGGRVLECIVIAAPCFIGSSLDLIVEDSTREPVRVAVRDASDAVIEQLVPGRVLRIRDPSVRVENGQSVVLRVDDSAHAIGWNCAAAPRQVNALRSCAKCHRARYCSRECQTQDGKAFGHRYVCT